MKSFIIKTIVFILPLLVALIAIESLLRKVPNDYSYKAKCIAQKASQIEVLCLGNSHIYFGINPSLLSFNTYNAAYVSQSLKYNNKILTHFQFPHLKAIVLDISQTSLYYNFEDTDESWRIKKYRIYYHLEPLQRLSDFEVYFEGRHNMLYLKRYYWDNLSSITSYENGYVKIRSFEEGETDLDGSSIRNARGHNQANFNRLNESIEYLSQIIKHSPQVAVLLITPPAYKTYIKHLDKKLLNKTLQVIDSITRSNSNVTYLNLLSDKRFSPDMFFDGDHLNDKGATKLSQIVDSILIDKLQ